MTPALDPKQIAATNPAVDLKKIEQAAAIRELMEKAGVVTKADYRISPPLGNGPMKIAPVGRSAVRTHHAVVYAGTESQLELSVPVRPPIESCTPRQSGLK